ncbi:MAG: isoamylase [Spirochaetaceae bacterium]|jgi:hypothetical protein|nr:isoamylase [Spirochaetaceae bacterium]
MKTFVFLILLLTSSIGILGALDLRSPHFIEYLLSLKEPGEPAIFEDAVVFTAPSHYKRVGVSFAHENFSTVHWFQKLLIPIDNTAHFDPAKKIPPEMLKDSGILFYAYTVGENMQDTRELGYRLIIDGLWLSDPLNPRTRFDFTTGAELSITKAPVPQGNGWAGGEARGELVLSYKAQQGESITVAGDFNGWDPFMYRLQETSPGIYHLNLPLPSGVWHYTLFFRGQRVLDPSNSKRVYSHDGTAVNTINIP